MDVEAARRDRERGRPATDEALVASSTSARARAFLVPEPTIAQRIVRAKRTLAEKRMPFEVPRGAEACGAAGVGARGHLPRVQRRLLGHCGRRLDAAGAVRGRAASRADPGRARAGRARGARARRAHGNPGLALERAGRAVGRTHPAPGSEPRAVGSTPHPPRSRGPRTSARHSAARRAGTRCRPRSPPATRGRARPRTRTGRESPRSTPRWPRSRLHRSSS